MSVVAGLASLASCATSPSVSPSVVETPDGGHPVEPLAGDRPAPIAKGPDGSGGPSDSDSGLEDGDGGTASYAGLVVNEVDYDQVSTDDREFVELFNGSGHAIDLDGLSLVLATASAEYDRVDLTGIVPAGGYVVVATPSVVLAADAGVLRFSWNAATNNMRNTSAAAVGILDTVAGELVDSLSYGGSVTAATLTDVAKPLDFVEGTPTAIVDSNTVDESLIRSPNGTDTDDANTDWKITKTKTPGAANILTP